MKRSRKQRIWGVDLKWRGQIKQIGILQSGRMSDGKESNQNQHTHKGREEITTTTATTTDFPNQSLLK